MINFKSVKNPQEPDISRLKFTRHINKFEDTTNLSRVVVVHMCI